MIEIVNKVKYNDKVIGYDIVKDGESCNCVAPELLIAEYKRNSKLFSNVYLRNTVFVSKHGRLTVRKHQPYVSILHYGKVETTDIADLFGYYVTADTWSAQALNMVRIIDDAVCIDKRTGTFKTKFGVCSLEELSRGAKTAVLAVVAQEQHINMKLSMISTGPNASTLIFEYLYKCMQQGQHQYCIPCVFFGVDAYRPDALIYCSAVTKEAGTFAEVLLREERRSV